MPRATDTETSGRAGVPGRRPALVGLRLLETTATVSASMNFGMDKRLYSRMIATAYGGRTTRIFRNEDAQFQVTYRQSSLNQIASLG